MTLLSGPWRVQARIGGSGRSSEIRVVVAEGVVELDQDIELDTASP